MNSELGGDGMNERRTDGTSIAEPMSRSLAENDLADCGTIRCAERIGRSSAGKKGEMMMGCVSEVLTTWPKTAGVSDRPSERSGDEADSLGFCPHVALVLLGTMTPLSTASSTTIASSILRRLSSS